VILIFEYTVGQLINDGCEVFVGSPNDSCTTGAIIE
jgi:hypothetical protein